MADRVVSLKPKPKVVGPTEHFVRLSRGENGSGFICAYVDDTGRGDFRTQEEFSTYDDALLAAQKRAHQVRRPLKDETGVEPNAPMPETEKSKAAQKRSTVTRQGPSFAELEKQFDEMPRLADGFALPDVADRLKTIDVASLLRRSSLMHRMARAGVLEDHAKRHGDSRDHTVLFSQKVYDQLQGQIAELHDQAITQQTILYGYLEAAFERIDHLEQVSRSLSYEGVWTAEREYQRGMFTTHGGSLWHCQRETQNKPGEGDHHDWVLAVRKGRDGKDARNAA